MLIGIRKSLLDVCVASLSVSLLIFGSIAFFSSSFNSQGISVFAVSLGQSPVGVRIDFASKNIETLNIYALGLDSPAPPALSHHVIRNIVYGVGGGLPLLLDLYLPDKAQQPHPAVIFVYRWGGGGQARRHFAKQAVYLAEQGIASAIISYRSSGPATFPSSIEDAKAAVRWVRANAEEYGINPDEIAAAGGSAGAQLAALLGTSGGATELEGIGGNGTYSSTVNLVIAFNGMFDMTELYESTMHAGNHGFAGVLEAYAGGTLKQIPEVFKAASPTSYIDELDPPVLLLHGTGDKIVPFEQSLRFKQKLEAAGVPVELLAADGAGHGFFNKSPHFQETLERMEEFIVMYFNQ